MREGYFFFLGKENLERCVVGKRIVLSSKCNFQVLFQLKLIKKKKLLNGVCVIEGGGGGDIMYESECV